MLLSLLNDAQKSAFFVLANKLTIVDGEDSPEEQAALAAIRSELGGGVEAPMAAVLGDLELGAFDTQAARVITVLELLRVAYRDQYLHEKEADLLGDISRAFSFSQERLDALVTLVAKSMALERAPDPAAERALVKEVYAMMRG